MDHSKATGIIKIKAISIIVKKIGEITKNNNQ
jgi:hypothetical protein